MRRCTTSISSILTIRIIAAENPHVRAGLTLQGAIWAFTSSYAANWVPLTWLSHMTDWSLFGFHAGAHHLTSVLLHGLSALLLFAGLYRMTGERWPSALVAFLFALHPLHVESVAWIAERKDVLSGLFWFLTIWAYIRYTERPGAGRYALLLAAFSLGLLAKPMMVTLPFVLLLLDVWPLGPSGGRRRPDQDGGPGTGESAVVHTGGRRIAGDVLGATGRWGGDLAQLDFARPAGGECLSFLSGVPRPDGVACPAGRVLSVSGEAAVVAGARAARRPL